jgi:hypothetical protein
MARVGKSTNSTNGGDDGARPAAARLFGGGHGAALRRGLCFDSVAGESGEVRDAGRAGGQAGECGLGGTQRWG